MNLEMTLIVFSFNCILWKGKCRPSEIFLHQAAISRIWIGTQTQYLRTIYCSFVWLDKWGRALILLSRDTFLCEWVSGIGSCKGSAITLTLKNKERLLLTLSRKEDTSFPHIVYSTWLEEGRGNCEVFLVAAPRTSRTSLVVWEDCSL